VTGKTSKKHKSHKKKIGKLRSNPAVHKEKTKKTPLMPSMPVKAVNPAFCKDKPTEPPTAKKPFGAKLKAPEAPSKSAFREAGKRHLKAPGYCRSAKSGACPVGSHSLPSYTPPNTSSKPSTDKKLAKR
jgi:hypothetical protein